MISSIVSRLVILVFGTLYPAYASYKAVRTKNVKEYVKWMMYWIVFALFTCAETFTDVFFSFWFPFYYEIKIILVLWLLSPATKGSSILYRRFVHPALCRREAEIDEALARATEQGYSAVLQLGTKGVNYATTMLMQTAIKGGGGLVQQLRKSYSLSDLVGEKEDENRNVDVIDEVDLEEPRRRERNCRRNYSPRRTQSTSDHVGLYFAEVDVDMRKSRSRDPVGSLTNIKSSDDISSGYSSGEALQSQKNSINGDHLVRTASVGARNRASKPRPTAKKAAEVDETEGPEISETLPNPFALLNTQQTLELLSFLSRNKEYLGMLHHQQNLSDSDDDSSTLKADTPTIKVDDAKGSVIDVKVEEEEVAEPKQQELKIDADEICSDKLNRLKELLDSANKAVATMVGSQENLTDAGISIVQKTCNTLEIKTSPSISRSNSDCSIERAGKYHKKPAPKAPEKEESSQDETEGRALKATLVIKTGSVKTLSSNAAVDAVIKRRKRSSAKTAARESFSKLLTIPKTIFHNAFHKDKDDESSSSSRENMDVTEVLANTDSSYVSLRSDSIDGDVGAMKGKAEAETDV
ncbi:uncharacterized protein LOC131670929 isoform X2 [Phymastichus coffea]|uniref:uncharacterized protein LOC131670929 isoform X2 n=1 Tax=Phymastichus coffea TaxID=108790 RepID=UPI00273CBD2C|nr:uncharacterized protein LOC131670929 isoform X2 [Phymastichus coffea]